MMMYCNIRGFGYAGRMLASFPPGAYPGNPDSFLQAMNDISLSTYCTTREAARILGVSVRTAQQWAEKGLLEAWKTEGGHRRISIASVGRMKEADNGRGKGTNQAYPEQERLKVVVVEDDNILLRLYRMRMEKWGLPIDLFTAHNGVEGLLLIGRECPDLLVTDLNMPEMDGLGMIGILVRSSLREGLEIVVVSGLSDGDIAERGGLPPGVRRFGKPVPFAELRAICEDMLSRRRQIAR